MDTSTVEILDRGMRCLVDNMGIVEAEHFIATVMRERFDYTKWQRDHFDKISPEQLHADAVQYEKNHPYQRKASVVV